MSFKILNRLKKIFSDSYCLSNELWDKLIKMPYSIDGMIIYRPVAVKLKNNTNRLCVMFIDKDIYNANWKSDSHKDIIINPCEIIDIFPSPYQLPVCFVNKLYQWGETMMGGTLFTLIMKDGKELKCLTGNILDFLQLPAGYSFSDIAEVRRGVSDMDKMRGEDFNKYIDCNTPEDFAWCIYTPRNDEQRSVEKGKRG